MMPTMPPDTHQISLKVIEAVKQHPVLYISEVKSSVIKLQEFRQKVWKRISDELGLDPTWVKLRWKNLRDTYCRILKYKNKTEKGIRRKKWIFEDHLSFLKFPYEADYEPQCVVLSEEYVREINDGGLSSDDLLEQLEDRNDEDYSEYLELEETTADPTLSVSRRETKIAAQNLSQSLSESEEPPQKKQNVNSYAQEIESKYRKIRPKRSQAEESVEVSNFNILQSPNINNDKSQNIQSNFIQGQNLKNGVFQENMGKPIFIANPTPHIVQNTVTDNIEFGEDNEYEEDEKLMKSSLQLFFDSMAQTVKKLPSKVQADIKMDVCRIVTEAEVRFSKTLLGKKEENTSKSAIIPKLVLIPCSMIDKQKK